MGMADPHAGEVKEAPPLVAIISQLEVTLAAMSTLASASEHMRDSLLGSRPVPEPTTETEADASHFVPRCNQLLSAIATSHDRTAANVKEMSIAVTNNATILANIAEDGGYAAVSDGDLEFTVNSLIDDFAGFEA